MQKKWLFKKKTCHFHWVQNGSMPSGTICWLLSGTICHIVPDILSGTICLCWLVHWRMSALHLSMQLLQKLEINLVVFQRNLTFTVSSAGIWLKETEDFMPLEEALCVSSVFLQENAYSFHLGYLRSWPRIRFSRSDGTHGCIPASPSHTVYLVNLKWKRK